MKAIVFLLMCVLSLMSCNVMDKIVGTKYWDEVIIEPYAHYDSSRLMPKRFMKGPQTILFVTDSTNSKQCCIIWGDSCLFKPNEMIYTKYKRAHAPGTGSAYWKEYLISVDEQLTYIPIHQ